MPRQKTTTERVAIEVPDLPPGVLTAVEVSFRPKIKFDTDEINALRELAQTITQRDMPARREEVIRIWEKRLFDRGQQHLLPRRGGGWELPAVGTGYSAQEQQQRSIFETNIYNSYLQILEAALTREVPGTRFEAVDPDNDADITAATNAETVREEIIRRNRMKSIMAMMARFLCTDGRALFEVGYVKDGQRFGYETEEQEDLDDQTVPETEDKISAKEGEEEDAGDGETVEEPEGGAERDGGEDDGEETGREKSESSEAEGSDEEEIGEPRGQELINVLGALESKLPIKAESLPECGYAQISREIDLSRARARYPDVAGQITAGQGAPGGDDIDRLGRINVKLGVYDQFVTTDSQAYDVTEQKTWFRPEMLLEVKNSTARDSLLKKAGRRGLRVIFCGTTFCEGRSISMDEQLVLCHALPGDGMHRPGLGDWLVPIQKVLNNWMELADDYFVHGVPAKWMDDEMFNVQKLREQVNMPGAIHPFTREEGVTMEQVIWEEQPVQFPQALQEFILLFQNELPQQLSGAHQALSGGGDSSATDTFGGMLVQRDQALGRLGLPWRHIKEAMSCVMKQAIVCLAKNEKNPLRLKKGQESITVQMRDLGGEFNAFPETDEGFPESHTQIQNRMTQLWTDAAQNPAVAEFVYNPDNLELFLRSFNVKGFYLPQVAARDKQLGECIALFEGGPVPNPQFIAANKQLKFLQRKALLAAKSGGQPDPEDVQKATALQAAIAKMRPQVSSVDVGHFDDDATELAVCVKVLNSPKGRALKNGTEDEVAQYQNLELHAMEHEDALQEKQAKNQVAKAKVSLSANAKDQPPKEAAAILEAGGIPADPKDFADQDVAQAAAKHPGPGGVQVQ